MGQILFEVGGVIGVVVDVGRSMIDVLLAFLGQVGTSTFHAPRLEATVHA